MHLISFDFVRCIEWRWMRNCLLLFNRLVLVKRVQNAPRGWNSGFFSAARNVGWYYIIPQFHLSLLRTCWWELEMHVIPIRAPFTCCKVGPSMGLNAKHLATAKTPQSFCAEKNVTRHILAYSGPALPLSLSLSKSRGIVATRQIVG